MAPKKPATKAAPAAKPKANTKAKVTKPAPAPPKKPTTKKANTTKTAAAPKKAAAADKAKAAPKKSEKPAVKAPSKTKKAAPATKESSTTASRKRKAEDDEDAKPAPAKKAKAAKRAATPKPAPEPKVEKKGAVINTAPTKRMNVYVFGEGSAGELGLGTAKNCIDVKRPRLNQALTTEKAGVVQISAGGMHVLALTHDNKILSWGVNDNGALGRDTTWEEEPLKDMDAAEDDSDSESDDDNGLNPFESKPMEVDWSETTLPEGTRFVEVAAGDSCSFVLTDDGRVYGWGTFLSNEGPFGFDPATKICRRPKLVAELKNITSITAGANHAYALAKNGEVFAWGSGEQRQLGRKPIERKKREGLLPRSFGLPKGSKNGIASISTGSYHGFAISKNGNVFSWGLNNYGQTGIQENAGDDNAVITKPQIIEAFKGKTIVSIRGGAHHSIAATSEGECLTWGRIDSYSMGIPMSDLAKLPEDVMIKNEKGDPGVLLVPQKVPGIPGAVTQVTTNTDTNIVVTKEGKGYSWGFSENYQAGTGVPTGPRGAMVDPTPMENTALKEVKLNGCQIGGQYGLVTALA